MFCSADKVGNYPIQISMLIYPLYADLEIQPLNIVFFFLSLENPDCALSTNGFFYQTLTTRTVQGCFMDEGEKGAVIQRSRLLYHSPHGQRILSWEFNPETHLSLC